MVDSGNIYQLELEERQLTLVGTAHISHSSVEEVKQVIEDEKPDTVCVELCPSRYESLKNTDRWQEMDILKVVREQKTFLLLANLIMSAFQKRLGAQLGVQPGAEMLEASEGAERIGAKLILADRDVRVTLQRTWRSMKFFAKIKVFGQLMMGLMVREEITQDEVEKLKQGDALSEAMEALASDSKDMKRILIDERDQYLAEKIRKAPGNKLVAVVGAGHIAGILEELHQPHNLEALEIVPPSSSSGQILKWGIPAVILGLIVYGFLNMDAGVSWQMIQRWFLINGILSALGAALAFAHPLTIISAFLAAPFTSLNPMIAAGWVAGLIEAILNKPQVRDFEQLGEDITIFQGFWKNKITRILLVVVFANLGSTAGTLIGGVAIATLL
ncbi:MAG: conjugal transfer protein TraB [Proteobacteria bacterium]|nr:conjugal transfer protein TraB [Pseudomonadota bacterium]